MSQPQLWTVRRAARYLGVSTKTVYRMIYTGRLKSSRISERLTRVYAEEITTLLETHTAEAWDDARMDREMDEKWKRRPRGN